jgi:two-component system sensor histidine kinase BaeS
LVYGLAAVVLVVVLGLGVFTLTRRHLQRSATGEVEALAEFYGVYISSLAPSKDSLGAFAAQIVTAFTPQAGYDIRLFDAELGGLLTAESQLGSLPSSASLEALRYRRPTLFLPQHHDAPDRVYAASTVSGAGGEVIAVVEVSRDISERRTFLSALALILAVAGGLSLIGALIASSLLARQMGRRLGTMESATKAIAAGDFQQRVAVGSRDEIDRVGASINQMAADLERLESARRDFIAGISHDLRTPLTAIKGLIINLQDQAPGELQPTLHTMDEQADRLVRLVDDLLLRSRTQAGGIQVRLQVTDLVEVLQSAVAIIRRRFERQGIGLSVELQASTLPVRCDADQIQRVIINLLDNALKATPSGGDVEVKMSIREDTAHPAREPEVRVSVFDTGPGISKEVARRAFEPYYRLSGAGTGLGLTIAQEIITAHSGRIWLKPCPEGGTEAGFALPIHTR